MKLSCILCWFSYVQCNICITLIIITAMRITAFSNLFNSIFMLELTNILVHFFWPFVYQFKHYSTYNKNIILKSDSKLTFRFFFSFHFRYVYTLYLDWCFQNCECIIMVVCTCLCTYNIKRVSISWGICCWNEIYYKIITLCVHENKPQSFIKK